MASLIPRLFFILIGGVLLFLVITQTGLISLKSPLTPAFFAQKSVKNDTNEPVSSAPTTRLITLFNQSCLLRQATSTERPPAYATLDTQSTELWWQVSGCADSRLLIRVVSSPPESVLRDTNARSAETFFSAIRAYTIMDYGDEAIQYRKARFQLVLAAPLFQDDTLFNPLNVAAVSSQGILAYSLSNECKKSLQLCQLWRFDRATGLTEQLWQSSQYDMVVFSRRESPDSLILSAKKEGQNRLIVISESDPNIMNTIQE
jgi:hypothetical protein